MRLRAQVETGDAESILGAPRQLLTEPTTQKHQQPFFQIMLEIVAQGRQIGACNDFRRDLGWIAQWPEPDEKR